MRFHAVASSPSSPSHQVTNASAGIITSAVALASSKQGRLDVVILRAGPGDRAAAPLYTGSQRAR